MARKKILTTNPLNLLASDRDTARQAGDSLVDRCFLGTLNRRGRVSMRTLVLREVDERLAVFYSRSSAKHAELRSSNNRASILILLPTVGVQYRIEVRLEEIARSTLELHWQLKPNAAKRMGAIYERRPQSTVIDNFEAFETLFAAAVPPRQSPPNSVGCFVHPLQVERLELRTEPHLHDRKLFELRGDAWHVCQLVP